MVSQPRPQFRRIHTSKAGKIVTVPFNQAFERMKHFDRGEVSVDSMRAVGATFKDPA
jgi:hypothetical protein